jgi:hypothetical protein
VNEGFITPEVYGSLRLRFLTIEGIVDDKLRWFVTFLDSLPEEMPLECFTFRDLDYESSPDQDLTFWRRIDTILTKFYKSLRTVVFRVWTMQPDEGLGIEAWVEQAFPHLIEQDIAQFTLRNDVYEWDPDDEQ